MLTDYDAVKAAKTRTLSNAARDEAGKVIRAGKNLSGNRPFAPKYYQLGALPPQIALIALPNQVQLILKWMADHPTPARGGEIIEAMIAAGAIRTKIDPPVLFAYYRRLMEKVGMTEVTVVDTVKEKRTAKSTKAVAASPDDEEEDAEDEDEEEDAED